MKTLLLLFSSFLLSIAIQAQQTYIYVSDAGGFSNEPWQILRYDVDGSNPQVFIGNDFFVDNGVGWPQDILFLEDQGVVLISCLVGGLITKHDATTGAYIETFAVVPGGPTRMKIGADNLIYVVQWSNSNNNILRFQQDGTPEGEFTSVGVPSSVGLDWDDEGNLYVGSYGSNIIRKYDTSGNDEGVFINTQLAGPTNLHFEPDGNLIVLNWNAGNVQRFGPFGNHIETVTTAVSQPEGIDVLPNGNYLIGNGGAARVDQFEPDGTFVESTVSSGAGGLIQPNAVVLRTVFLSIEDETENVFEISPTIGNNFTIHSKEAFGSQTIEVYNILGLQVDTIQFTETTTWDASQHAEGVYFLTITSDTGKKNSQKVIVQKN